MTEEEYAEARGEAEKFVQLLADLIDLKLGTLKTEEEKTILMETIWDNI